MTEHTPEDATEYTSEFYQQIDDGSLKSAYFLAECVWDFLQPASVIDLGCGVGNVLSVFRDRYGVSDVTGVDGDYVDRSMLKIPQELFIPFDLGEPFSIDRRFDLAVSLEVAEHLEAPSADAFVDSLCALSDTVMFSAAIPLQGGVHHVNEQWPNYWAERFNARGYLTIDPFRRRLWDNDDVEWWYRQNLLLFATEEVVAANDALKAEHELTDERQLALIHPVLWDARNKHCG